MLANFLKTVDPAYKIEFRTDTARELLIIRVTRGFLFKEAMVSIESSTDENHVIGVIRNTIDLIADAFGNYD